MRRDVVLSGVLNRTARCRFVCRVDRSRIDPPIHGQSVPHGACCTWCNGCCKPRWECAELLFNIFSKKCGCDLKKKWWIYVLGETVRYCMLKEYARFSCSGYWLLIFIWKVCGGETLFVSISGEKSGNVCESSLC